MVFFWFWDCCVHHFTSFTGLYQATFLTFPTLPGFTGFHRDFSKIRFFVFCDSDAWISFLAKNGAESMRYHPEMLLWSRVMSISVFLVKLVNCATYAENELPSLVTELHPARNRDVPHLAWNSEVFGTPAFWLPRFSIWPPISAVQGPQIEKRVN